MSHPAVQRARRLKGRRYKHLGRSSASIDCIGLAAYAYDIDIEGFEETAAARRLGAYFGETGWRFDKDTASHVEAIRLLLSALTKRFIEVSLEEVKAGDLLLISYKVKDGSGGDHLGIYTGRGEFLHVCPFKGVEEIAVTPKLRKRIHSAWRRQGDS